MHIDSGTSAVVTARLVADIGGTNARFAMLDETGIPVAPVTLRCDDFASLGDAMSTFIAESGAPRPSVAAIAVATPVVDDLVALTNNRWSFSIEETRRRLALERLEVVNDFTALALSLPQLPSTELEKVGGGSADGGHPLAVIGPGTGLGVSGLVPCADKWLPLQGEGGHVTLGANTPRELAVHTWLSERYRHVSAERWLSGPGLVNIVSALREIDGLETLEYTPAIVTERGLSGEDAACREALELFCSLLGSCAGNLVLTLGAQDGVYIGGGIAPRLGDFFARSGFRESFEAKGRMRTYLERVPSFVIRSPYPALIGAARLI